MIRSLINRFKEFRRPKKPRKSPSVGGCTPKRLKSRTPGIINSITAPTLVSGEDATSYEWHITVLKVELKKVTTITE